MLRVRGLKRRTYNFAGVNLGSPFFFVCIGNIGTPMRTCITQNLPKNQPMWDLRSHIVLPFPITLEGTFALPPNHHTPLVPDSVALACLWFF